MSYPNFNPLNAINATIPVYKDNLPYTSAYLICIQSPFGTVNMNSIATNGIFAIYCENESDITAIYFRSNTENYPLVKMKYDNVTKIVTFYFNVYYLNRAQLYSLYLNTTSQTGYTGLLVSLNKNILGFDQCYELVLVDSTDIVVTSVVKNSKYTYKWKCKSWNDSTFSTSQPFTSEDLFTGTFTNNYTLPTPIKSTGITATYNTLFSIDVALGTYSFVVRNENYFAFSQRIEVIDEPKIVNFNFTKNDFFSNFVTSYTLNVVIPPNGYAGYTYNLVIKDNNNNPLHSETNISNYTNLTIENCGFVIGDNYTVTLTVKAVPPYDVIRILPCLEIIYNYTITPAPIYNLEGPMSLKWLPENNEYVKFRWGVSSTDIPFVPTNPVDTDFSFVNNGINNIIDLRKSQLFDYLASLIYIYGDNGVEPQNRNVYPIYFDLITPFATTFSTPFITSTSTTITWPATYKSSNVSIPPKSYNFYIKRPNGTTFKTGNTTYNTIEFDLTDADVNTTYSFYVEDILIYQATIPILIVSLPTNKLNFINSGTYIGNLDFYLFFTLNGTTTITPTINQPAQTYTVDLHDSNYSSIGALGPNTYGVSYYNTTDFTNAIAISNITLTYQTFDFKTSTGATDDELYAIADTIRIDLTSMTDYLHYFTDTYNIDLYESADLTTKLATIHSSQPYNTEYLWGLYNSYSLFDIAKTYVIKVYSNLNATDFNYGYSNTFKVSKEFIASITINDGTIITNIDSTFTLVSATSSIQETFQLTFYQMIDSKQVVYGIKTIPYVSGTTSYTVTWAPYQFLPLGIDYTQPFYISVNSPTIDQTVSNTFTLSDTWFTISDLLTSYNLIDVIDFDFTFINPGAIFNAEFLSTSLRVNINSILIGNINSDDAFFSWERPYLYSNSFGTVVFFTINSNYPPLFFNYDSFTLNPECIQSNITGFYSIFNPITIKWNAIPSTNTLYILNEDSFNLYTVNGNIGTNTNSPFTWVPSGSEFGEIIITIHSSKYNIYTSITITIVNASAADYGLLENKKLGVAPCSSVTLTPALARATTNNICLTNKKNNVLTTTIKLGNRTFLVPCGVIKYLPELKLLLTKMTLRDALLFLIKKYDIPIPSKPIQNVKRYQYPTANAKIEYPILQFNTSFRLGSINVGTFLISNPIFVEKVNDARILEVCNDDTKTFSTLYTDMLKNATYWLTTLPSFQEASYTYCIIRPTNGSLKKAITGSITLRGNVLVFTPVILRALLFFYQPYPPNTDITIVYSNSDVSSILTYIQQNYFKDSVNIDSSCL
jgi:hypothetical protein